MPIPLLTPAVGPPALWRTSKWCLMFSVVCVAFALGFVIWRGVTDAPRLPWHKWVVMAFGFAPALIVYPVGYLVQRRVIRDWRASGGRLCATCAYDLSASENAGTCPECGKLYDLEQDAQLWADVGLSRE